MDNRKWESDAIASPPTAPASPSDGYPTNGNPLAAQNATEPGEWWFHAVGEELRAVIVEGGLTPTISVLTQLRDAVKNIVVATSNIMPGTVAHYAMSSAPTGFLKANGAAVSRTTYAALFSAIGTTFGVGDGATTFNVPDLRGEFIRGWDDARGIDSGRGFGSAQTDTLQGFSPVATITFDTSRNASGLNYYNEGGGTVPAGTNWDGIGTTPDSSQYSKGYVVSDGVHGNPRLSTETKPRNIALLACIKY